MQQPAYVQSAQGRLRGTLENGIHVFRGIPYGADTSGSARFKHPGPVVTWAGVRDCMQFGAMCPQHAGAGLFDPFVLALLQGAFEIPSIEPGEDCLKLNVWTPGLRDGGNRPVMVWLHGGRFSEGSGGNAWCDGSALARRGDVVVVTLNHRLNLFGYLDPEIIADESPFENCNAGMLDIVAALEWIADHIVEFGGNPGNVTLFGSSGGGSKIGTLMAMPKAKGLFHKAIIQSATLRGSSHPTARHRQVGLALLAQLGLQPSHVDALRNIAPGRLIRAGQAVEIQLGRPVDLGIFVPTVESQNLPESPFGDAAPAPGDNIPLMIGSNSDEMTLLLDRSSLSFDFANLSPALQRWAAIDQSTADQLIECYRDALPAAHAAELFVAISTDYALGSSTIAQAEYKSRQSARVYMYRFQWRVPAHEGFFGAMHGAEVPFVFGNVAKASGFNARPAQYQRLEQRIVSAWTSFARTGDPNHADLPGWPPYSIHSRDTLCFGSDRPNGNDIDQNDCTVQQDPNSTGRLAMSVIDAHRIIYA